MDPVERIRSHFAASAEVKLAAAGPMAPLIARAAEMMTGCLLADGRILACGNGGSAADCQHFSAELLNRFEMERPSLAAISLTTALSSSPGSVLRSRTSVHDSGIVCGAIGPQVSL
mgnify:CR=1 FL=1